MESTQGLIIHDISFDTHNKTQKEHFEQKLQLWIWTFKIIEDVWATSIRVFPWFSHGFPPGDGDDTPKRGRGILSDSWDLASLDPATWPVLKARNREKNRW